MSIIIWQGHTKRTIRLIFTGMSSIFIEDTQIPQVGFVRHRPAFMEAGIAGAWLRGLSGLRSAAWEKNKFKFPFSVCFDAQGEWG